MQQDPGRDRRRHGRDKESIQQLDNRVLMARILGQQGCDYADPPFNGKQKWKPIKEMLVEECQYRFQTIINYSRSNPPNTSKNHPEFVTWLKAHPLTDEREIRDLKDRFDLHKAELLPAEARVGRLNQELTPKILARALGLPGCDFQKEPFTNYEQFDQQPTKQMLLDECKRRKEILVTNGLVINRSNKYKYPTSQWNSDQLANWLRQNTPHTNDEASELKGRVHELLLELALEKEHSSAANTLLREGTIQNELPLHMEFPAMDTPAELPTGDIPSLLDTVSVDMLFRECEKRSIDLCGTNRLWKEGMVKWLRDNPVRDSQLVAHLQDLVPDMATGQRAMDMELNFGPPIHEVTGRPLDSLGASLSPGTSHRTTQDDENENNVSSDTSTTSVESEYAEGKSTDVSQHESMSVGSSHFNEGLLSDTVQQSTEQLGDMNLSIARTGTQDATDSTTQSLPSQSEPSQSGNHSVVADEDVSMIESLSVRSNMDTVSVETPSAGSSSEPSTVSSSAGSSEAASGLTASSSQQERMRGGGLHTVEENAPIESAKTETNASQNVVDGKVKVTVQDKLLSDSNGRRGQYSGTCIRARLLRLVPHGKGKMVYKRGIRSYEGDWSNGLWHGRGKVEYAPKDDYYAGKFEEGQFHGHGIRHYADGSVYEGRWEGGERSGRGVVRSPQGNVCEGEWVKDRLEGQGRQTFTDGALYEGMFVGGLPAGQCKYKDKYGVQHQGNWVSNHPLDGDGTLYDGLWKDGKQHGFGKCRYHNGDSYKGKKHTRVVLVVKNETRLVTYLFLFNKKGCFDMGLKHGRGDYKSLGGDGQYSGEWRCNKPHGRGRWKHPNEYDHEGEYRNGLPNGEGRSTWADGGEYTGSFVDGKMDGRGKLVEANGAEYEGGWKNGKRHGQGRSKTADGTTEYTGSFVDGRMDGRGKQVKADGETYDGEWKKGKRHGKGRLTYANGDQYKGKFAKGLKHGSHGCYTRADGTVWHDGRWKNDKPDKQT